MGKEGGEFEGGRDWERELGGAGSVVDVSAAVTVFWLLSLELGRLSNVDVRNTVLHVPNPSGCNSFLRTEVTELECRRRERALPEGT
jgi:hypothetical protein